jgi:hypothetical protein
MPGVNPCGIAAERFPVCHQRPLVPTRRHAPGLRRAACEDQVSHDWAAHSIWMRKVRGRVVVQQGTLTAVGSRDMTMFTEIW